MTKRSLLRLLITLVLYALLTRVMFPELSWSAIAGRTVVFGVLFQTAMSFIDRRFLR